MSGGYVSVSVDGFVDPNPDDPLSLGMACYDPVMQACLMIGHRSGGVTEVWKLQDGQWQKIHEGRE